MIAQKVQSLAEEQHTSVATFVSAIVVEHVTHQKSYDAAQSDFLARQPVALHSKNHSYPNRDSLHERSDFR